MLRNTLWKGLILLLGALLLYQLWIFWHVHQLADQAPEQSAVMRQRLAEMASDGKTPQVDQRWIPAARISRHLQRAVVASEDAKFYQHHGFDWEGIQDAWEANLEKGEIVRGGSTISQQLAKNLFLSTHRTPWRKGQEAVVTVMLERTLSKRRILEIYLNVIEWGDGVFGAEAAARHYFKKSAASLTPREAAWLAAIIPNPRFYDKRRNTRHIQHKTNIILGRMMGRYELRASPTPQSAPATAPVNAEPALPLPAPEAPQAEMPSADAPAPEPVAQ